MTLKDLRIVFMGTPDFAVASLEALVKAKCNIVGVITAPDKPAGRGMKMTESAVKKFAVRKGLKILQPEKLKNPDFLNELRALNADLQIVVAFRMLPESVWNMPPLGTINLHGSLLPQYRGAAPINWAVINGEKETGVTTFKLKHEIDTGNILLQERFPIDENETAGEVHDKMKEIGARVLVETVKGIAEATLEEVPQLAVGSQQSAVGSQQSTVGSQQSAAGNEQTAQETSKISGTESRLTTHDSRLLHHAPKITTDTCRIHWTKSIDEIHNLIRGLSPYPAAFTELGDKTIKIFRSEKEPSFPSSKPGRWESDGKTYLKFAAKDGYILLKDVQLEGKKRMSIEDFLRGYRFG